MPAGIIRGALARIGYQAAVVPEVMTLPQCKLYILSAGLLAKHLSGTFQVKLPKGS